RSLRPFETEDSIRRSIRQGCPLSAMLFSIAVEPLAGVITADDSIRGVVTPAGRVIKILAYADDTSLVLKDETSVDGAMRQLRAYCGASGAKVNINKSEIFFLGSRVAAVNRWGFREATDGVKVLGVWLARTPRDTIHNNWTAMVKKLAQVLALWKMRRLTLRGKVTVLNSLIFSKINYVLSILPLPVHFQTRINEVLSLFLWGSRANQISKLTLSRTVQGGGLGLISKQLCLSKISWCV
uniref:Reverse transcriptase domain-containing protein n=1 Tax=Oryzias latipes TaxID=8090 RepID=A0A3P9LKD8_ORYLA